MFTKEKIVFPEVGMFKNNDSNKLALLFFLLANYSGFAQLIRLKDSISSYSYYNPKPDGYNRSVVFLQNLKPYVSEKDPYYFLYLQYLGEAYEYYGEFGKALNQYKVIKKLGVINDVDVTCYAYYKVSRIEKLTGDIKNAIGSNRFMLNNCLVVTNFEQADQNMGMNYDYLRELIYLYTISKQYKSALNMAFSLPSPEKTYGTAHIMAKMFYEKQQFDSAAYYCRIYESSSGIIDNYFISKVYYKSRDTLDAKENYLKALKKTEGASWEQWRKENFGDNPEKYYSCWFYNNIKTERTNILKEKKKWGLK